MNIWIRTDKVTKKSEKTLNDQMMNGLSLKVFKGNFLVALADSDKMIYSWQAVKVFIFISGLIDFQAA